MKIDRAFPSIETTAPIGNFIDSVKITDEIVGWFFPAKRKEARRVSQSVGASEFVHRTREKMFARRHAVATATRYVHVFFFRRRRRSTMRAVPIRCGKRTNERSISLPVQSKMDSIWSFRLAFVTSRGSVSRRVARDEGAAFGIARKKTVHRVCF